MREKLALPLVVYREWALTLTSRDPVTKELCVPRWSLAGRYQDDFAWDRERTTARCGRCEDDEVPNPLCHCGLHGYVCIPDVWTRTNWRERTRDRSFNYTPNTASGAALLWGRMQIGTQFGIARAQYGSVLALLNTGRDSCRAAEAYGVPVMDDERLLRAYAVEHGQEMPVPNAV